MLAPCNYLTAPPLPDAQGDAARRIGLALSTLMRAASRAKAHDAATGGVVPQHGRPVRPRRGRAAARQPLAEAVHADPSTLSRQVSALAEQGLISREPDPADGRATLLAITAAGRTVFAERMALRNRLPRPP